MKSVKHTGLVSLGHSLDLLVSRTSKQQEQQMHYADRLQCVSTLCCMQQFAKENIKLTINNWDLQRLQKQQALSGRQHAAAVV